MKNGIKHVKVQELVSNMKFNALVYQKIAEHRTTAMNLSEDLGQSRNYLYRQLAHNNQSAALLLALSQHLKTNLFEPYINLLPEELRTTQREKELQRQMAALEQQITDLIKERDIYKSIALK
jgi:hypothetical protein